MNIDYNARTNALIEFARHTLLIKLTASPSGRVVNLTLRAIRPCRSPLCGKRTLFRRKKKLTLHGHNNIH